jgi:hypothetical protein
MSWPSIPTRPVLAPRWVQDDRDSSVWYGEGLIRPPRGAWNFTYLAHGTLLIPCRRPPASSKSPLPSCVLPPHACLCYLCDLPAAETTGQEFQLERRDV